MGLVLLKIGTESVCDVFNETYIWSGVSPNSNAVQYFSIVQDSRRTILVNSEMCTRCRQTLWFMAEASYLLQLVSAVLEDIFRVKFPEIWQLRVSQAFWVRSFSWENISSLVVAGVSFYYTFCRLLWLRCFVLFLSPNVILAGTRLTTQRIGPAFRSSR